MKQFGIILKFELLYFLKNKIFVGVTLALILLIGGVMCFPRLREAFVSEEPSQDRPIMLVSSGSSQYTDAFAAAFPDYDVQSTGEDADAIRELIRTGQADCAFLVTGPTAYTYWVNNLAMTDMNAPVAEQLLRQLYIAGALTAAGLSPAEADAVMNIPIQGATESLGKDQNQNFFYTYIMIFALYMVIMLYGQLVATNVATEKSSRAMELLVTSARPASMMFGKVLAGCLAGLAQLTAIFGSALALYRLNREYWGGNEMVESLFNIPGELLGYMLVFFVLGFLIYAFLFGAIGSTASKLEDINTSTMPLMFLFIIAFMVVMFSMTSGQIDSPLMMVCSFLPFTSPMAMFTRIAMSTVAWYETALSIGLLAASVVGIGLLSAKIYRVGVLLYGTPPKLSHILKAIRKA